MEITNFEDITYWIESAKRDFMIIENLMESRELRWIPFKISDFLSKMIVVRSMNLGIKKMDEPDCFLEYFISTGIKLCDREIEFLKNLDEIRGYPEEKLAVSYENLVEDIEMLNGLVEKIMEKN